MRSLVIVHYDANGEPSYFCAGEEIRLFIVDERAPNDRVYEWLTRDSADTIKGVLRDDPIGSSSDDRHEAIKHRVLKAIAGKRQLEPVE